MEVHHHSHTGRKRWTHYFWEFFMLFLAVTLGFFVENQREHFVEQQREKQYMKSLLHDLKNDTANFARTIRIFQSSVNRFDSLKNSLKSPIDKAIILNAYKLATVAYYFSSFNYSDRTIEQLRNAGNFRIIREPLISDTLIEYDRYIRHSYLGLENVLEQINQKLTELQNQIFNYDIYAYLLKRNWQQLELLTTDSIPYPLKLDNSDGGKLNQYYNSFGQYGLMLQRMVNHSHFAKSAATRLMALVKKEYRLE